MHHILILDDDENFANYLKRVVDGFDDHEKSITDLAFTPNQALTLARSAIQSSNPHTIFLIDQRLGSGMDGIEAMQELLAICPDSDAVIFTGFDNSEDGIRAYDAGASRYLSKTSEPRELIFVLKDLARSRREKIENKWRMIFSEMMEIALRQSDFIATAKIIVEHSLKLGFERAHLFWAPKRDEATPRDTFVGIECSGDGCISRFPDIKFNLQKMKALSQYVQSHDTVVVNEEDVHGRLEEEIKSIRFQFPTGEWWILALWSGTELLGALTLDFWKTRHSLSIHERTLLDFFARQVAVTLERASLYGREKRTAEETAVISQIGRQVSTRAATKNLKKLLEQIREQISKQFDVSNFSIFLYEEQTNTLNFELLYQNGISKKGASRIAGNGMEEYMLSQKREINTHDIKEFTKQNGIKLHGVIPTDWLGAPLQVGEKIIGGVSIQQYNKEKHFSEHDKRILRAVADQVAGAVQISNLKKVEDEDKERMQLLQRASVEMLRIAHRSVDDFWLTVLTLATANFGLGFNRALLFLIKDNQDMLYGRAGVGTNDTHEAIREWKRDEKRKYDFDGFLKDIETKQAQLTPFHKLVSSMEIPLEAFESKTRDLLEKGEMIEIIAENTSARLPAIIINYFAPSTCALLPIRAGNTILGLVIVDNKHNQKPLNQKSLNSLQTILANAGLVWETLRQRAKSEDLLDANYAILGGASHQPLKETLNRICKTARMISQADWSIIYPFTYGVDPHEIEVENFGYDGELTSSIMDVTKDKILVGGVSTHVLQKNELVVDNIDKPNPDIGKLKLSEHHFIKSEGVKALIGISVKDPYTSEPLGIFYLDYRQPHNFPDLEIHHAKSLASLAAVAISNYRHLDENRQRRLLKAGFEISETIGVALNLEDILPKVLEKLKSLFHNTALCILLYNEDDRTLQFAPTTLKFYKIENPEFKDTHHFPLYKNNNGSIACKVAGKAILNRRQENIYTPNVKIDPDYLALNPKTTSELCVSLMSSAGNLLGVLALERTTNSFDEDDIDLVETVAHQLGLAIERAQQSEELAFKSTVATMTAWASDIAHDINNEVGRIRGNAYLIKQTDSENKKIAEYADKIDESAKNLSSVGPWSSQAKKKIPLDIALKSYLEQIVTQRNVALELLLQTPDIYIMMNPNEFQRVIRHLVRNAARAMEQSRETIEKKIFVCTNLLQDGKVEILFQDFGPGINEKIRSAIFQRRTSTKPNSGGYGLLMARQLVDDMGGKITLLPAEAGKGAMFSIKLPVVNKQHNVE